MDINSFLSACEKIDEAIQLEASGKIDIAQTISLIEAQYTKEFSDMLRETGMSDRDIWLAVFIIETSVFILDLNIMDCYNKCAKYMKYYPDGCVPNKLVSISGVVQAIMVQNLYRTIHDELCINENIINNFNDLCYHAYKSLQNYEGALNAEAIQEQIIDIQKKYTYVNGMVDYVRDGIEPVRPDTGEKLAFTLDPKQITYVESHPGKFDGRLKALASISRYAHAYDDVGPDIFDRSPYEAEKFVRTYCEYVSAHRDERLDYKIHFAFVSTVMHFHNFMYNGVGFVPPDLLNSAISFIVNIGKDHPSTPDYIISIRNSAGRFMCLQRLEDPMSASLDSEQSNWGITFYFIESLADRCGIPRDARAPRSNWIQIYEPEEHPAVSENKVAVNPALAEKAQPDNITTANQKVKITIRRCPKCKTRATGKFCINCGTAIKPQADNSTATPVPETFGAIPAAAQPTVAMSTAVVDTSAETSETTVKAGLPTAIKILLAIGTAVFAVIGGYIVYQSIMNPFQSSRNTSAESSSVASQPASEAVITPDVIPASEATPAHEVIAIPEATPTPDLDYDSSDIDAYKAYFDILKEKTDAYGIGRTEVYTDYGLLTYMGVIYADLIDFDNNGLPELLLIWNDGNVPYADMFTIYGYTEGLFAYYEVDIGGEGGSANGFEIATSTDGMNYIIYSTIVMAIHHQAVIH